MQTSGLHATSGSDFTAIEMSPISLDSSETANITVEIIDDRSWEPSESFAISMVGIAVGTGINQTVVEILDDDRK